MARLLSSVTSFFTAPRADFAEKPGATRPAFTTRRAWLVLAMLGLCLLVLFARKPDQFFNPQFWAEDGFFYQSALGGWPTLWEPYNGYLHLVPRLVAAAAWWWDPAWAPTWFVGCAAAGTLYVAFRALSPRQPLSCRPVLALAVVAVPDAFEVLLNITNLQWLLAAGFFLLLVSDEPRGWLARAHDLIATMLLALTGPFSVVLSPLFLGRALLRRTWFSWLLGALVVAAAVIQLRCMLQFPQPVPADATVAWQFGFGAIGMRLAGSLFCARWLDPAPPMALRFALSTATFLVLALAVSRRAASRPSRVLLGLAFLGLLFASLYRCRWVLEPLNLPGYGARYFFPLQLILLWLVIDALTDPRRSWRVGAATLLILILAANVQRLREPPLTDFHWHDYAPRIRQGEAVVVPINPAGWTISFPARPAKP